MDEKDSYYQSVLGFAAVISVEEESICMSRDLGPVVFLTFINDLIDSLENPLYLFSDVSTLCHDISHPSDRQAGASSLSSDLDKSTNWSNTWNVFQS